ncbi:protein phosphatase 1 regulatory subunit 12B isoform X15 [Bradysia coprophila]|uniref:protein phosphatase 1 regulatory subunit 12B isoform X15 n=1 Tax=Bradysia coprophila TaxID=38358 RepID=UPI00187D84A3|nr:protein phosphatase 1 regulatory subunit 12B isoform X15 [Bradysia coprophila]
MSFDTRNNSAMYKRAEQLKRWEESDTNREPPEPKNLSSRKIKFSSGCVFLAACMSADRAEVLRLLDNGADIDTVNVDGLTALHQACIDDNLEMVEFLVQQGADVNRQDNEGWTPLHATSSCGFLSIANYLIENGADLAAVSGDGELAIDVAESNRMEELLQKYINEKGIDCDEARQSEERQMLTDAKNWLRGDASKADEPHPRTGATALHVAAAKGYSKVLSLLLATRADVDKQDNDGWTPLHAAAHWGQKEAAQMLVAALADMDVKNYAGQTPIDVADPSMIRFLEDLKKNNKRSKRRPISQIRISDNMDNHIETPSKVIRVDGNEDKPKPPTEPAALVPKDSNSVAEDDAPWRRSGSLRTRAQQESPPKTNVPERESVPADSDVILRRTQSFEEDEKKTVLTPIVSSPSTTTPPVVTQPGQVRRPAVEELVKSKFNSVNNLAITAPTQKMPANRPVIGGSALALDKINEQPPMPRNASSVVDLVNATAAKNGDKELTQTSANNNKRLADELKQINNTNTEPATIRSKFTPGNIFKNFFKSFVPPVRDEESETQRKAHAKRVRETRRSTQGVTLDEIKSAEELVKKKNMNNNNNDFKLEDVPASNITSTSNNIISSNNTTPVGSTISQRRQINSNSNPSPPTERPVSAPVISTANSELSNDRTKENTSEVTLSLRRPKSSSEDKENDKENDSRTAQATQAVIQRRRRPKRRSTGVVHVDMDDIDPERQDGDIDDKESGSESRTSRSRLGSTSSLASEQNDAKSDSAAENGDIDYKALYEASRLENEKLKTQLKKKEDDLSTAKATVDRFTNATTKNSLSELEKRERRAMERKLSEMEEELKLLQKYKTENERLRAENRALTRVVSKLTTSAQSQLHNKQ